MGRAAEISRLVVVGLWFIPSILPYLWLQLVSQFLIRPFSIELKERIDEVVQSLFGLYLRTTFGTLVPSQLVLYGNKRDFNTDNQGRVKWLEYACKETTIGISNHQIYTDWANLWMLAYLESCGSFMKFVCKEEMQNLPFVGLGLKLLGMIFVKRSWDHDQKRIEEQLDDLLRTNRRKFIVLFPEGTTVNPKFMKISDEYAEKHNYEKTKYTLIPRSTGLYYMIKKLQSKRKESEFRYMYDFTIGYSGLTKHKCPEYSYPIVKMFSRFIYPKQAHILVRRYKLEENGDYPPINDQERFKKWLLDIFYEKDELMTYFYEHVKFPIESGDTDNHTVIETKDIGISVGNLIICIFFVVLAYIAVKMNFKLLLYFLRLFLRLVHLHI